MRRWIDWYSDGSVAVVDLSLACCGIESEFAVPEDAPRLLEPPSQARLVALVSGTLTDALAPLVRDTIAGFSRPPTVIAFGACACAGGPYWDSYAVTKGCDQIVDVDLYIAGCPPPPDALSRAIDELRAAS